MLNEYQALFEAQIAATLSERDDPDINIGKIAEAALQEALPSIADLLYDSMAERSAEMLREHRSIRRGFVTRNKRRWRRGFDLIEELIVISQEAGGMINEALRPKAAAENDALFEAAISNHARAIQVAREILTLMVAGFPDGAMGRWRTLHEIAVVSNFISGAGAETAERYVLHVRVTSYKRAMNYMEHHERANLEPIELEVMQGLKVAHDEIVDRFGSSMKHDYGWAAASLGKDKPTLLDLEVATRLDHWRPRYKWATINTHGGYRRENSTLATCESEERILSVGESNSGMTDPGHMLAITLCVATLPVINLEPNLDRLAIMLVMNRLSSEIGETLIDLEHTTMDRFQKSRAVAT